ncbi:MAG: Tripartite tricarboxylate transporter family receptor [Hyphomicrobiales bacterium]|jgi:tripartite-type tricarboxylate transporter receptor subunit TctC|nr:Tripartite tricarboxylate transporter family receptor [Hyphomicrobiales bacterium]
MNTSWKRFGAACIALGTTAGAALADDAVDFYKGKTVNYIVATAPGGGYDSYGRLVAEYMQRNLPGSTFVVKNMPGAGHIIGTNAIYASKADGLTIGTFNTGLIYNQIINANGVKFDLSKMSWIGKAASDPRVIVIAAQSPIKSFADLVAQKSPVNFATAGLGSASYVETVMLTNSLKLPVKNLTGYNGTDDQLAMRRGEVVGSIASRSSYSTFVENGYGRFIAQIGGADKDLPQLSALVKDPGALALINLVQSQGDISRLTAGPPGIPADRLGALIGAYRKALEDKDLQARAEKLERPVEPAYGEDVAKAIAKALDQSDETKHLLADALKSDKK